MGRHCLDEILAGIGRLAPPAPLQLPYIKNQETGEDFLVFFEKGACFMFIDSWEDGKYREIWVELHETEEDERAMCGLINGDWGWLNYYAEEGDLGLSSRNPDYRGGEEDTMDFITNGELDPYPLAWVIPAALVMEALTYFEENRKLPSFITWHDDNLP